jgi:hypothetical protein
MRGHDQIMSNIEKRIADFTFIPVGMFVLPFVAFFVFLICSMILRWCVI